MAIKFQSSFETIKCLIEGKTDLNRKFEFNYTPLHFACCFYPDLEVIKCLVESKSDVNLKDDAKNTPIEYSIKQEHSIDILIYLIEKGSKYVDSIFKKISFYEKSSQFINKNSDEIVLLSKEMKNYSKKISNVYTLYEGKGKIICLNRNKKKEILQGEWINQDNFTAFGWRYENEDDYFYGEIETILL